MENQIGVSSNEIGSFVDSKAGKKRTAFDVAGRLIEEITELCLAAGLNSGQIYEHVTDAIFNQATKRGHQLNCTVFPSRLAQVEQAHQQPHDIKEEAADASLVLKDLCHVLQINLAEEERKKFEKFKQKEHYVSPQGTLYSIKKHVK